MKVRLTIKGQLVVTNPLIAAGLRTCMPLHTNDREVLSAIAHNLISLGVGAVPPSSDGHLDTLDVEMVEVDDGN